MEGGGVLNLNGESVLVLRPVLFGEGWHWRRTLTLVTHRPPDLTGGLRGRSVWPSRRPLLALWRGGRHGGGAAVGLLVDEGVEADVRPAGEAALAHRAVIPPQETVHLPC